MQVLLRALGLGSAAAILLAGAMTAASPDVGAGDGRIAVEGFAFTPSDVTIQAGGSVTWAVRKDPEQHTVTPKEAGAFEDSGPLFAGDDYTIQFDVPGRYAFVCVFHPFMTGSVVVETAAVSPLPSAAASASASAAPSGAGPTTASSDSPAVEPSPGGSGDVPVVAIALLILALGAGLALARSLRRRPR